MDLFNAIGSIANAVNVYNKANEQKQAQQQPVQVTPEMANNFANNMAQIGQNAIQGVKRTAYQMHFARPVQEEQWYQGTVPTTREIYAQTYKVSK